MSARRPVGPALLDVNVLIALAWPNHEGHSAARAWFDRESRRGWATSPVTETGFVRVSSNRGALATATTPRRAVDLLEQLTAMPGHAFWDDSVPLVTGGRVDLSELRGHRQVTDAHLVALCIANHGRLVTFDQAITDLVPAATSRVQLLQAGTAPPAAGPEHRSDRE